MSGFRIGLCIAISAAAFAQSFSVATAATVAYWQFDRGPEPTGASLYTTSVGGAPYALTFTQNDGGTAGSVLEAKDPIPNPDSTPGFVGTPATNDGSVLTIGDKGSYFSTVAGSSSALNLVNNAWTFEGWIHLQARPGTSLDYLFGTRDTSTGFMLDVRENGAANVFNLFVTDGDGDTQPTAQSSVLQSLAVGFTPTTWYHFALTYNSATGSNGGFELFLDGSSLMTLNLPASLDRAIVDNNDLGLIRIAGRNLGANSFGGRIDEFRISNTVLAPNQFLNYVPEPSSALLAAIGAVALIAQRRRRRR